MFNTGVAVTIIMKNTTYHDEFAPTLFLVQVICCVSSKTSDKQKRDLLPWMALVIAMSYFFFFQAAWNILVNRQTFLNAHFWAVISAPGNFRFYEQITFILVLQELRNKNDPLTKP